MAIYYTRYNIHLVSCLKYLVYYMIYQCRWITQSLVHHFYVSCSCANQRFQHDEIKSLFSLFLGVSCRWIEKFPVVGDCVSAGSADWNNADSDISARLPESSASEIWSTGMLYWQSIGLNKKYINLVTTFKYINLYMHYWRDK